LSAEPIAATARRPAASIEKAIDEVLAAYPEQIAQYHAGNQKIIAFLVGRIMKAAEGKLHPQKTNELLRQKLDERKQ